MKRITSIELIQPVKAYRVSCMSPSVSIAECFEALGGSENIDSADDSLTEVILKDESKIDNSNPKIEVEESLMQGDAKPTMKIMLNDLSKVSRGFVHVLTGGNVEYVVDAIYIKGYKATLLEVEFVKYGVSPSGHASDGTHTVNLRWWSITSPDGILKIGTKTINNVDIIPSCSGDALISSIGSFETRSLKSFFAPNKRYRMSGDNFLPITNKDMESFKHSKDPKKIAPWNVENLLTGKSEYRGTWLVLNTWMKIVEEAACKAVNADIEDYDASVDYLGSDYFNGYWNERRSHIFANRTFDRSFTKWTLPDFNKVEATVIEDSVSSEVKEEETEGILVVNAE